MYDIHKKLILRSIVKPKLPVQCSPGIIDSLQLDCTSKLPSKSTDVLSGREKVFSHKLFEGEGFVGNEYTEGSGRSRPSSKSVEDKPPPFSYFSALSRRYLMSPGAEKMTVCYYFPKNVEPRFSTY